jgi:23S rRNA (cytosine1962-C5)-methyltransferase
MKTIALPKQLETALASGHPWLYRNRLPARPALEHGEWVRLEAGRAAAVGLYDRDGQIAVRLFATACEPDDAFWQMRVDEALALREAALAGQQTTAYRLLYGEGDYLPGITADRYGRHVVMQASSSSVAALLPQVAKALARRLKLRGIAWRREDGLQPLWGELPPPEVTVSENGLKLLANLYEGQKTGLFLDHRDNRARLERYCQGRRVLNLFCYSGAFSLYALRGGAAHLVSVDSAAAALEDAKRNFALNGFDANAHAFVKADVFELLEAYAQAGRAFDLVVCDPPTLARSRAKRHAALRAYARLNTLAIECVASGGLLATASCTAQVSAEAFRDVLAGAATAASRRLQLLFEGSQGADHPVPAGFPEGRYLKFALARVLP